MRTRNPIKWLPALTAMTLALSACEQETSEHSEAGMNNGVEKAEETVNNTGGYKLQGCADDDGASNC